MTQVHYDNPAVLVVLVVVALFFALFGYTVGHDRGPLSPTGWVGVVIGIAFAAYAYFVHDWPWVAASLGVFVAANAIGSLSGPLPLSPHRSFRGGGRKF